MTVDYSDAVAKNIDNWHSSLFPKLAVGGLIARSCIAHKWKTPFRCVMLREATFWREHDLMNQSHVLFGLGHVLGARILLRGGVETLATLTYLNILMQKVVDETLDFHVFGEKTTALLLGSRNNDAMPKSINIMTVLEKCDKRYAGIIDLYADLSETAHPSHEGLCSGYSKIDHDEHEAIFSNRWMELRGGQHLKSMSLCMETFHHEYNEVWPALFERMENWIVANDERLESTKGETQPAS